MKKSFTPSDLIFLAYCETNDYSDQKLFETMLTNEEVMSGIVSEKKKIVDLGYSVSPSKKVISNIMSYSKALSVIKSEKIGIVNLLMN